MVFYGKKLLQAEKEMKAAFSDISQNCHAALIIGMSRLRSDAFFPAIWQTYHKKHPNIAIEQIDGNSSMFEAMLQDGKIDLYIGIDPPSNANQVRVFLANEKMQCCMTKSLLQKYRPDTWKILIDSFSETGVDLAEMVDIPFITTRSNNRLRRNLDLLISHRSRPNFTVETNQQDLIYQLAKLGEGIGIASPVIFYRYREELRAPEGELYIFPINKNIGENSLYLIHRKDYKLPEYIKSFIDVVREVFNE